MIPRTLAALAVLLPVAAAASPDTREALVDGFTCDLVARLDRIHDGDRTVSRGRYLSVAVLGRERDYVQCIFIETDTAMWCEAAGAYRPAGAPEPPISPGRRTALRALGFAAQPDGNDAQRVALGPHPDFSRIARLILVTLHDAYGVRPRDSLTIRAPNTPWPFRPAATCAPAS